MPKQNEHYTGFPKSPRMEDQFETGEEKNMKIWGSLNAHECKFEHFGAYS